MMVRIQLISFSILISTLFGVQASEVNHASSSKVAALAQEICTPPQMTVEAVFGVVKTRIDAKFEAKEHVKKQYPDRKFSFSAFGVEGVRYVLQTVRKDKTPRFSSCSIWVPTNELDKLVDQVKIRFPVERSEKFAKSGSQSITSWETTISNGRATVEVWLNVGSNFPRGDGIVFIVPKAEVS